VNERIILEDCQLKYEVCIISLICLYSLNCWTSPGLVAELSITAQIAFPWFTFKYRLSQAEHNVSLYHVKYLSVPLCARHVPQSTFSVPLCSDTYDVPHCTCLYTTVCPDTYLDVLAAKLVELQQPIRMAILNHSHVIWQAETRILIKRKSIHFFHFRTIEIQNCGC